MLGNCRLRSCGGNHVEWSYLRETGTILTRPAHRHDAAGVPGMYWYRNSSQTGLYLHAKWWFCAACNIELLFASLKADEEPMAVWRRDK